MNRNVELLYGFSFFDPFMIVIPVWMMDMAVESAAPSRGIRRGWFGREQAPAGVALTLETELGYTLHPAAWGQGFATEAARCVRDDARRVLRLPYTVSAIVPDNARSRRVAERGGARPDGQMDVVGLVWDRWRWPLATGDPAPPRQGDGRQMVHP